VRLGVAVVCVNVIHLCVCEGETVIECVRVYVCVCSCCLSPSLSFKFARSFSLSISLCVSLSLFLFPSPTLAHYTHDCNAPATRLQRDCNATATRLQRDCNVTATQLQRAHTFLVDTLCGNITRNTLQHAATRYDTLQHTVTHFARGYLVNNKGGERYIHISLIYICICIHNMYTYI